MWFSLLSLVCSVVALMMDTTLPVLQLISVATNITAILIVVMLMTAAVCAPAIGGVNKQTHVSVHTYQALKIKLQNSNDTTLCKDPSISLTVAIIVDDSDYSTCKMQCNGRTCTMKGNGSFQLFKFLS